MTETTYKIPFLDLKRQYQSIKTEVFARFEEVCENTAFSGGKYVEEFEKHFANYCQTQFALGVDNGTSALHLAMLALGIEQGDEVIVPANTFIATAWGVSYCNATPVFVDCTADTWEIDASKIEEKITPKTKAIAGVHLYGQPFDIDAVKTICEKHNLFLIEDAAQAHGAYYKGKRVGGFGEMACFSFYPGKNLGAYGEAGGITTNNEKYYKYIQSLRNHGSVVRYYHDEIGYNMRMGGLEAVSLSVKLKYLDAWNNRRKEIAKRYQTEIKNSAIRMQHQPEFADSVYHLFVVTTEKRDDLMKYLHEKGIFPGLHYPVPCHLQKAYAHLGYQKGDCPNAEYLAEHCLTLPMFAELTDEEVSYIIEVLNTY
ncbi:DegT/DnrJ/EryC1/StrS family aminotransferase [Raineya orbicola]|jgi:dTDP-4-amino-4,6-dideoxygalactose transaminase|uniref:Putative pyridoxal phosphate-dependent enzyme n=1 Tax=Raineya orbicola TaxID=2016530 RepID=A0A2N3IHF6_9BACT|nr:DegT/DnrJ/EryC1/StrS family aminotransferase [Raineya orbicola]PKQ69790.1 putative pyridoxal phosphate-dependent enzyme [Raineya orbicola]